MGYKSYKKFKKKRIFLISAITNHYLNNITWKQTMTSSLWPAGQPWGLLWLHYHHVPFLQRADESQRAGAPQREGVSGEDAQLQILQRALPAEEHQGQACFPISHLCFSWGCDISPVYLWDIKKVNSCSPCETFQIPSCHVYVRNTPRECNPTELQGPNK